MDAPVTTNDLLADAEMHEKMALLLAMHNIDEIGSGILIGNAADEEVILCIEGGNDIWSDEVEELLDDEVLSEYDGLGEDEWILIRAPLSVCIEIASTVDNPELSTRLQVPPENGLVRVFLLFDTGEVATDDVPVESQLN